MIDTGRTAECPICRAPESLRLVQRRGVPVHQNLLFSSPEAARSVVRGDIDLRFCSLCGFAWNALFDATLLDYGASYDSDQSGSRRFTDHVAERAEQIVRDGVADRTVVEVGCGTGYFVSHLCAIGGVNGIGVDSAYRGPARSEDGRVEFRSSILDEHSRFEAETLVCRHVIEHVPDPVGFLRAAVASVGNAPDPILYFETPALEWILEHGVGWDVFYEHCSLFSAVALRRGFAAAGFGLADCSRVFGEQYLWIRGTRGTEHPLCPADRGLERHASAFPLRVANWLDQWRNWLADRARKGSVAIWGAAAKGTTFVNLFDPERERVQYLVDINPRKAGRFIAGTGHPIVPPASVRDRPVDHILVVNPLYIDEVREMLSSMRVRPQLQTAE